MPTKKNCIYPSIIVSHINCRKIILKHTHTHTHIYIYIYYMWLKGVRKFKGLRFILVNSQIFNFFMALVSIVVKKTNNE